MNRVFQSILIVATVIFAWLAMLAVHEFGHVLHAWLSGGGVQQVVLDPRTFSRTDVVLNPHPLWVAWGGVLWGCLIPLALWGVAAAAFRQHAYLPRWFAGFCLISNGAYLAAGPFAGGGPDGAEIVRLGWPAWPLVTFGAMGVAAGLALWNGLGPRFGLGAAHGDVDRRAAVLMAVAAAGLLAAELAFSLR